MQASPASRKRVPSPPNPDARINVLIISEIRLFGEGLALALAREVSLSVCGFGDLADAISKISSMRPDIVLLNAGLRAGIDVIDRVRNIAPQVRVVALAIADEPENVIAWAEAGAAGYIPSNTALCDLVPLLADIVRGEQPCSARVAAGLLQRLHVVARSGGTSPANPSRPAPTAREVQILQMIGEGLSNKEIARRLNIGVATTKSHVHNLLGKLGLQKRGQAASWIRKHQVQPEPILSASAGYAPSFMKT
jgi:two-component system, NarL family, nitrate/nitrite response regulator NarL